MKGVVKNRGKKSDNVSDTMPSLKNDSESNVGEIFLSRNVDRLSYKKSPNNPVRILMEGDVVIPPPVDPTTNYSNVVFVDEINGDNSTAEINNFRKPARTLAQATYLASTLTPTSTNRALVYVRRGTYSLSAGTYDCVDYYSEPGTVYTGGGITNTSNIVSCNFMGYAQLQNTVINILRASTFNIEFDTLINSGQAVYVAPTTGTATVNIKGNYIYSGAVGSGYGISIRNSTNITFHMTSSRGIEAVHSTINFRFFTGKATINSNIFLAPGNLYGGNFKQALICYDASTTGTIIVNGDIENNDTVNYGGIGSLITMTTGANPKLKVNGNLKGGPIKALDGNTATSATIDIRGNMSSDNTYTFFAYGAGEVLLRDGVIKNSGVDISSVVGVINGTAKVFLKGCDFYNGRIDSDIISIAGVTANLIINNCTGASEGVAGYSIVSSVGPVAVKVHSSRFNKELSADIGDTYTPSGFIHDPNTVVPTTVN